MNNCKPSEERHRIAVGGRVLRVTKSVGLSNDSVLAGLCGPVCRTSSGGGDETPGIKRICVRATGTRCSDENPVDASR